jgi:DNA-binding MarR family transcriptional regulator
VPRIVNVADRIPLSALLSQVLVAFTIEFDNEFEHAMPHRTTTSGPAGVPRHGPWLVSMAMWANCMKFVSDEWMPVRELERLARTPTNLAGMERWGYLEVKPDPADARTKPPREDLLIRSARGGRKAQEVWRPLTGRIEDRWRERLGSDTIDGLRDSLAALVAQLDPHLPDSMPILGYGLFTRRPPARGSDDSSVAEIVPTAPQPTPLTASDVPLELPSLLARALVAFAAEFEETARFSLAISADVLRVIDADGTALRELPGLGGVSKEAVSMAMGILSKRDLAFVESSGPSGRTKLVRLTDRGLRAKDACRRLEVSIESNWSEAYGERALDELRDRLERLVGNGEAESSPLFAAIKPYPDGWRVSRRTPTTLPHFPMVLHRGGYPDGS